MTVDLLSFIDAFAGLNVLVIGDVMLDSYLHGASHRLCPEAPVPVVDVHDRIDQPGGAANTALNIHSLAANVTVLSVIGADPEGHLLQQALQQRGVATDQLLTTPTRRTLAKHRVMASNHLLVRFDQGSTAPIDPQIEANLIDRLTDLVPQCDALIVSDYGYGILTPRLIQTLTVLQARYPRILVVDSKQLAAYRSVKATAVKPNYSQTIELLGHADASSDRIGYITTQRDRLLSLTGAAIVAVTLDRDGALIFEQDQPTYRTYAQPTAPIQTTGAGDTYVSALTLALAAGASTSIAAEIAATAAAIVVAKQGTAICQASELRDTVRARSRLGNLYTNSLEECPRSNPSHGPLHDNAAREPA